VEEPRKDSLRPWATATASPQNAQCIRNETWVHNQHPSVAKPIRATPGHPVPTFRRRTGSDGNGTPLFAQLRPF